MTPLFGRNDTVAIFENRLINGNMGGGISYTKSSLDPFYSKWGFALPLTLEGILLDDIFENKFPERPPHAKQFEHNLKYFHIDHKGATYFTGVAVSGDSLTVDHLPIRRDLGWWKRTLEGHQSSEDDRLFAFLFTDPSSDQIEEYVEAQFTGRKIQWVSISSIVEELNARFPIT